MKLLLTSGGITNDTLAEELEKLAGVQFSKLKVGFIPTASLYSPHEKGRLIDDMARIKSRGAKVYIISLADLYSNEIIERLEEVDVILMGGGDNYYLSYMLQERGLFAVLPKLLESKVYVGISAGSMILAPSMQLTSSVIKNATFCDPHNDTYGPTGRTSAKTLGLVDFHIRPHFLSKSFPFSEETIREIATTIGATVYAIDDNCAVRVVDGDVSVVGDGEWRIINPV